MIALKLKDENDTRFGIAPQEGFLFNNHSQPQHTMRKTGKHDA